jgi:mandelate racemase
MALSAIDIAIWDALAVAAGVPLATLLGATLKPIPAYNSSGLGLMSPEAAADKAEKLLAGGFRRVKLRLGHPTLEQDLAVTRTVRKRLPESTELPVDYKQALTVAEAIRRGRALAVEPHSTGGRVKLSRSALDRRTNYQGVVANQSAPSHRISSF